MKKDLSILFSWVVRYTHILVIFVLFPLFIFTYANVFDKTDSDVNIVADPVYRMVKGSSRILSQQEATYLQRVNNDISNNWLSDTDAKYELSIREDNSFSEYYDDDKFGWGEWRVYSATSTASSSITIDGVKPLHLKTIDDTYKFYLQRTQNDPDSKGENYLYEIYFVDPVRLILVRVDNDKTLSFVRPNSATSTTKSLR